MISQHVKIIHKTSLASGHYCFEIIAMFVAGFLPQNYNLLANSLISLTCGIQVVTFAKCVDTISARYCWETSRQEP